jgi:hypothetical protein
MAQGRILAYTRIFKGGYIGPYSLFVLPQSFLIFSLSLVYRAEVVEGSGDKGIVLD